jgi:hypothetical protein
LGISDCKLLLESCNQDEGPIDNDCEKIIQCCIEDAKFYDEMLNEEAKFEMLNELGANPKLTDEGITSNNTYIVALKSVRSSKT